jgi:low affinity Fe/Cu permease
MPRIKLRDRIASICILTTDWISHPLAIILFPIVCVAYMMLGGAEGRLTLILSILAISLTQMVLNAQNVDSEATKLQIAELVRVSPEARDTVIDKNLTIDEMKELEKEIQNAITNKVQLAK